MAKATVLKTHLERPEIGMRGKTMCGANAPTDRVLEDKKKVTCGRCNKVLTGNGTWFTKTKRARTIFEKKQK